MTGWTAHSVAANTSEQIKTFPNHIGAWVLISRDTFNWMQPIWLMTGSNINDTAAIQLAIVAVNRQLWGDIALYLSTALICWYQERIRHTSPYTATSGTVPQTRMENELTKGRGHTRTHTIVSGPSRWRNALYLVWTFSNRTIWTRRL